MIILISSASEADLGALFHNSKAWEPIRVTLEEMFHPQQATPMQTDNSTMEGTTNDNIHKKYQSNGYVVLLSTRYNLPGPLQRVLETSSNQFGRLFHQT